jgi:hypothetical protein
LISGDFMLAKQVLYHLSHTSSPFCSGYFGDVEMGSHELFFPSWLQIKILPISASKIARITSASHCPKLAFRF